MDRSFSIARHKAAKPILFRNHLDTIAQTKTTSFFRITSIANPFYCNRSLMRCPFQALFDSYNFQKLNFNSRQESLPV